MLEKELNFKNTSKLVNRSFRVVISFSEEDNVYYASVPSIENCITYGDTIEEAMKHIRDAAEGIFM